MDICFQINMEWSQLDRILKIWKGGSNLIRGYYFISLLLNYVKFKNVVIKAIKTKWKKNIWYRKKWLKNLK